MRQRVAAEFDAPASGTEPVGFMRRYTVHARRVVVTADSLRTPQLLYAFGIRPCAFGRYFNEHFQMFAPIVLDDVLTDGGADGPVTDGDSATVRVPFRDDRQFQGQLLSLMGGPLI
ncbi:hypothetical protein HZU40_06090 [Mycolicibacterium fluoranthenivorans]|uniref:Uncharacterized protein n=1 Tax=Mycolicibacterium fluoranthenivorans TaxID=258505 RepID=A0A7G8PHR2_9MYCO|nr:hypothetical protein [Mycolicibacterium fluoranthenivorans]QNJ93878.1 hypothetical protein HZU40_06090 [Mycolicibacterium fluoranthenivorans]